MRRGTTPTITFYVRNTNDQPIDLTGCDEYHLTFREIQNKRILFTITDITPEIEGDATKFTVDLTQEQTLMFGNDHSVEIQLRARKGDKAIATTIVTVSMKRIIEEGVI